MTTDSHIIATIERMQQRADYIAGLRALADLLDEHTTLPLPYSRDIGLVFVDDEVDLMNYAGAMDAPVFGHAGTEGEAAYSGGVRGSILGIRLDVRIRGSEAWLRPCESDANS